MLQSNAMEWDSYNKVYLAFGWSGTALEAAEKEIPTGGSVGYETRMRIARVDVATSNSEAMDFYRGQ